MNDAGEFRELIRKTERMLGLLSRTENDMYSDRITLAQCHALVEIGRSSGISIKKLSNILVLDKSTMSRTVDALLKKGYAERKPSDTDKREVNIELSKEGQKVFTEIESNMNKKFFDVFERIDDDDRESVLKSLRILVKVLGTENFNK